MLFTGSRVNRRRSPAMSVVLSKQLLSINKRVLIMSYYTRIFNCVDDTGEHPALCGGNYSSVKCRHKWDDADVENIWAWSLSEADNWEIVCFFFFSFFFLPTQLNPSVYLARWMRIWSNSNYNKELKPNISLAASNNYNMITRLHTNY